MKFLLVTSTEREIVKVWVCQETSPAGSLLPPVDLASVAATIKSKGHQAQILDLRLYDDPWQEYHKEYERFRPDAIILNLTTTSATHDYQLIASTPGHVKKICFGTHAQEMVDYNFNKGVDFILLGDPEAAIASLIDCNMDGSRCLGVMTPKNNQTTPNYWENLDTLPKPALDLLDMTKYHAPYIKSGHSFTLLLGGRGCPYLCTYCLYPVLFGNKYRLRSVNNIADEIEEDYQKYDIKEFLFLDATFNSSSQRVHEFCEELLKRDLKINWACNMRVTPVSIHMLELMKRAGCSRIFFGVEDQDLLDETKKATTSHATTKAFKMARKVGIATVAFTMLFPRDDLNESQYSKQVLSILNDLKADAFQCNIAIPFPGTEMYEKEPNGVEPIWSKYDPHGELLPYKANIDLVRVKKKVYRSFLISSPFLVLKAIFRMNFKSFCQIVKTFIKQNVLVP